MDAKITGYSGVADSTISNYLSNPLRGQFDPAKATEYIACQAYIDFFRQPAEAWAWWKRTGFPNTTSTLAWPTMTANGSAVVLPRRASFTLFSTADANYTNQKAAYDAMATDPNFGTSLSDVSGRIWWDMP